MRYQESPKHKRGCSGSGPPRWFPTVVAICPDDVSVEERDRLLAESIEGRDVSHPHARARYALDDQGRFFKAYSEDGGDTWHGYPVNREMVPSQVPARVLRKFVSRGLLGKSDYKNLLGQAR